MGQGLTQSDLGHDNAELPQTVSLVPGARALIQGGVRWAPGLQVKVGGFLQSVIYIIYSNLLIFYQTKNQACKKCKKFLEGRLIKVVIGTEFCAVLAHRSCIVLTWSKLSRLHTFLVRSVARFVGLWCQDGVNSSSMGLQMSTFLLFISTQVHNHEFPIIKYIF